MPLTRFILSAYGYVLEACMWVVLVVGITFGDHLAGLQGAVAGLFMAFVMDVSIFGALLLLVDIRDRLKALSPSTH